MKKDKITIKIRINSKECEQLRDSGLFFETIADTLWLERKDIKEVVKKVDRRKKI